MLGLGYVGFPLAVAFASKHRVVGFDSNAARVAELRLKADASGQHPSKSIVDPAGLEFTSDSADLAECELFIIAVPTSVDSKNRPDLSPLTIATGVVGRHLRSGSVVIFESTVFPGCTEDVCIPILEQQSGLTYNRDFFVGYSPERINPGDTIHSLAQIVKVTSGSTPDVAEAVDRLYSSIISAGTYMAPSIKVAETAKILENIQRDVNIALMNEFSMIVGALGIEMSSVLPVAKSKWNFLDFRPGLVGGHCVAVNPYYMIHAAESLGRASDLMQASRRVNEQMPQYVAASVAKLVDQTNPHSQSRRVLILGATYKADCDDARNSKVPHLVRALEGYGISVDVWDPTIAIDDPQVEEIRGNLREEPEGHYQGAVLAAPHQVFLDLGVAAIRAQIGSDALIFDIGGAFPRNQTDAAL